ncbi:MAG: ABC transporter permease [Planctomycetota bacterium]|nr:ABC transporter permease [Planctomycetota bacterium]
MSATLAIARRELLAYMLSPAGYIVTALFLFFTSLVYFVVAPLAQMGFSQGRPASLRLFFQIGVWVLFVIGPAISMRTISEELRLGTLESLLTAPITEAQIILGKFFGSLGFLVLMLLPTVLFVFALERYGRPDYGELLCGYLGLLLIGAALLASGMLISTLTSSQVLAYIATIFFWLILLLATMALPFLASQAEGLAGRPGNSATLETMLEWLQATARFLAPANPGARVFDFVNGLVDSFNIVYFVSLTILFLVAAIRALGARRWP